MTMPSTVADAWVEAGEDREAVERAAALFRALGDPTRLLILRHLFGGEHRVADLTAHLDLAQSTVSAHVACLRECGLLDARPVGRATLYSLAHPELLTGLLGGAEGLLAATGDAVVLCHHLTQPATSLGDAP